MATGCLLHIVQQVQMVGERVRVINGKQGQWSSPYLAKEEALNTLAETLDSTGE